MKKFILKYKITISVCALIMVFGFGWWILAETPTTTKIGDDIIVKGSVGIGTTEPRARVHIFENSNRQFAIYDWLDASGQSSGYGWIGGNAYLIYDGGNKFKYSNTHGSIGAIGIAFNYPSWNKLSILSSGTTSSTANQEFTPSIIATFDYAGNVGIGTTAPESLLSLANNSSIQIGGYSFIGTTLSGSQTWIGFNAKNDITTSNKIIVARTHTSAGFAGIYMAGYGAGIDFVTKSGSVNAGETVYTYSGRENVRMTISGAGNVGIGTTAPASKLSVGGSGSSSYVIYAEGPSYAVYGNASGGSSNYGVYGRADDNSANYNYGLRGYAYGGINAYGVYASASGATGNNWGLYVSTGNSYFSGNVGIGTTSPSTKLAVYGLTSSQAGRTICSDSSGNFYYYAGACVSSSRNYKKNIFDLNLGLESLMKLRPVTFEFREDYGGYDGTTHMGFIAEEVSKISPILVDYDSEGLPSGVRYTEMTALLTNAIKEQQNQIEELKLVINKNSNLTQNDQEISSSQNQNSIIDTTKQALARLSFFIENGIAKVKELFAEKIFAQTVQVNELEMVDKATGEIYCTWIENGEWQKAKGKCQGL